jgi:hypothetical protein
MTTRRTHHATGLRFAVPGDNAAEGATAQGGAALSKDARAQFGLPLSAYELPALLVLPAVMACRIYNTLIDGIFYDVPGLLSDLHAVDIEVATTSKAKRPSRIIDLDALSNPEGALLLIDATTAPYVHRYTDVTKFLGSPYLETRAVEIVTITGVGSSALGSAAFGWDVSKALHAPVLAIVPGYGVADMVLQALGGWFGFGLFDWLNAKSHVQATLARIAPAAARVGRELSASSPGAETLNDAPVYRRGSGSSDVLHDLITRRAESFRLLVGHSKGALQIANAISQDNTTAFKVVTLGCPAGKYATGADYEQYLGVFDALGQANMWGHWPDHWIAAWHTTNPWLPPAMDAGALARIPAD